MDATAFTDRWWTSKDGLRLHARDYAGAAGDARLPVVCIHGLTRNARDFEEVAPYVAATGRRVLALDVRGRGLSAHDPAPMNYHPATYANDVVSLFDQAGISRAIFLGTSMGGIITMALSAIMAPAIAGAILNDVGPEVSPVGLARIAGYVGKSGPISTWDDAAAAVKLNNGVALPHYTDADWMKFARRTYREAPDGAPKADYDFDIAVPMRAAGAQALAPALWPLFKRLARKRMILTIRGATSDILDPKTVKKMQRAAPHMGYTEIPGVGHAPMLDEPAAKAAILDFLSKAP
ncbi:MAG TPA: alpha/beta hydrolase [Caulobacteraceae bacterium]|jgi:pimeloyl-ACP methyl ester carboxylesterase|nr:alpha/beta hydrolase [Caulobacteraceae bacterium]